MEEKEMKKFLATLCAVMLLVTSLAGMAVAEEKTKVVVWTPGRADYDYMLPVVEKFNETNQSNIEIVYEVYSDNFQQVLELAFDTGNGPDIYYSGNPIWAALSYTGRALPLNDMLTDEQYQFHGGEKNFG